MSDQLPIHEVQGRALGKRPPLDKPALMLRPLLTGTVPLIPEHADYLSAVSAWELGRNYEFGTCGPTSVANHLRLVTTNLATPRYPSLDDVFDLYRRSGNPGFDPDLAWDDPLQEDSGVYMHEMLDALLREGIGGHKPVAFAKIAPGDFDTLDAAIAIFGGVLLGLDLQAAQQTQSTWDYKPTTSWGGHAVMAGKYADPEGDVADRTTVVTWAEEVEATRRFIHEQEDEAWVVIWPEHLGSRTFLDGIDQDRLREAYQSLTGRALPAYTPPAAPAPSDTPADDTLQAALARFLKGSSAPKYLRDAGEAWLAEQQ